MRATADSVGQDDATDRASFDIPGIHQNAFGSIFFKIGNEADQIAIVLIPGIFSRHKRRLAAVALLPERKTPRLTCFQVVLDQT